jgi:hypothetical protein
MRGRPFDGWAGSDWPFDDAVVSRAEVLIMRAARRVVQLAAQSGQPDMAINAVTKALEAVPDPSIEDALRELQADAA